MSIISLPEDIISILIHLLELNNDKIFYLAQLSKDIRAKLLGMKYSSERIIVSSLKNRIHNLGVDIKEAKSLIISLQNNNLLNKSFNCKNSVSIDDIISIPIKRETIKRETIKQEISIPVNDIILYYSRRKILICVICVKNHCIYSIDYLTHDNPIVIISHMDENYIYRTLKNGYDITKNSICILIKREEYMALTNKDF